MLRLRTDEQMDRLIRHLCRAHQRYNAARARPWKDVLARRLVKLQWGLRKLQSRQATSYTP